MGKTSKPLNILVHPLLDGDMFGELRDKGHMVHSTDSPRLGLHDYDLILTPNAWRMTPQLLQYLDDAIKAARQARYGGKHDDT